MSEADVVAEIVGRMEGECYGEGDGDRIHSGSSFQLTDALIVGQIGGASVVTRHPIDSQGTLGMGCPMQALDILAWAKELAVDEAADGAWLPKEALYSGAEAMMWVMPASVRPMCFLKNRRTVRYTVPWPRLVLVAHRQGALQCFAIKSGPVTPHTRIYHAPLMNFFASGQMCFGDVGCPDFGWAHREAWEAAVTQSRFSHTNHERTLRLDGGAPVSTAAHLRFWKGLEGAEKFPNDALVATGARLVDVTAGIG